MKYIIIIIIIIIISHKPYMGCGPRADWLMKKRYINTVGIFDYNLWVFRCLAIHKRYFDGEENYMYKRNCEVALNLAP